MELFKGQSLLEFTERFKTDLDCEEYLASIKLGSVAEGEPAVYNLQWVKEEQIIRNSKIEKVVTLVADTRNIPNGEEVTVKVHTPEQDGGSSMLTELKGIV